MEGRAEAHPWASERPRQAALKDKNNSSMSAVLSYPRTGSHRICGEMSSEPPFAPVVKENPRRAARFPQHCSQFLGVPTLTMGIIGRAENPVLWESDWNREVGGACRNQQRNLGRPSSCWQHHVVIPTSDFGICRTKVRNVLNQGTSLGADLSDPDSQERSFAQFSMPRQGAESLPHPLCEWRVPSSPVWLEGLVTTPVAHRHLSGDKGRQS